MKKTTITLAILTMATNLFCMQEKKIIEKTNEKIAFLKQAIALLPESDIMDHFILSNMPDEPKGKRKKIRFSDYITINSNACDMLEIAINKDNKSKNNYIKIKCKNTSLRPYKLVKTFEFRLSDFFAKDKKKLAVQFLKTLKEATLKANEKNLFIPFKNDWFIKGIDTILKQIETEKRKRKEQKLSLQTQKKGGLYDIKIYTQKP